MADIPARRGAAKRRGPPRRYDRRVVTPGPAPAPGGPAPRVTRQAAAVRQERALDLGPGIGKHRAQDLLHHVEMLLTADQWRGELHDRVAAVVGPADQA